VKAHDKDGRGKEMLASLPDLPQGEAWVWNPRAAVFKRITVRRKWTFDSGATPKAGEKAKVAKVLSPVDVQRLGERIAAAAERAKNDDPKHLREVARRLTDELAKANAALAAADRRPAATERVEVPVIKDAQLRRVEVLIGRAEALSDREAKRQGPIREAMSSVSAAAKEIASAIASIKQPSLPLAPPARDREAVARGEKPRWLVGMQHYERNAPGAAGGGEAHRGSMMTKMLSALSEEPERGLTRHEIRVFTGYADSGPVSKAFAQLLADGLARAGDGQRLVITPKGIHELGPSHQPLPRGHELFVFLMNGSRLSKAERKILSCLHGARSTSTPTLTRDQIRQYTGYADSGPISKAMSRLITFGYAIDEGRAGLRAADRLFD